MEKCKTNTEDIKLLKPKNDIVFQSLFSKNNEKITKAFVQALLEEKIDKIVINNDKELFRENPNEKLGILDLELDINNKEKVDVEIQLIDRHNLEKRLLFYFAKLYQSQIKRGYDYIDAKKVVLIAIIDYSLGKTKDIDRMETVWKLIEKCDGIVLTDDIEIHIIELEKVKNTYMKDRNNKKAQWMLFLDNPNSKEVQEIMEENKEIEEATVVVKKMSKDEKLQRLADLREKAIMDEKAIYRGGVTKGKEEGKKEGKNERNKEIAEELLRRNMSIKEVANITTLSIDEVEKIKNKIK